MFEKIIKLIENNEFEPALNILDGIETSGDPKAEARVNYLLGYIHTCREFKKKKDYLAKRYLLSNINSEYPQPYAYVLYARIENDKNVATNYLLKGSLLFQGDPRIYLELFRQKTDKDALVEKIQNEDFSDFKLITEVIEYLIEKHEWAEIERFIFRLQNNDTINDYDNNYLELLKAYSHIFREEPNYVKSLDIFKKVIDADIDNNLAYSHYLGIIYAYINTGDIDAATLYFDKLPIDDSIHDLDEGPWYTIFIDFNLEYKAIFQQIIAAYSQDYWRKQKAKCLYSLYLYYPSVIYDKFRYKKEHVKALERYLKTQFNKSVAAALFNMYCHFKQYIEANNTFFEFLTHYENPDDMNIDYSYISDNANENDLQRIVQDIVVAADCGSGFDNKIFIRTVFKELVGILFSSKQYSLVVKIADILSNNEICNSGCAFECAFSYAEVNTDNAQTIYEDIIKKEQKNSSAINNLGVIYERKGELDDAKNCFASAYNISPDKDIYRNNLDRINKKVNEMEERQYEQKRKEIRAIAKNISLEFFDSIGYSTQLTDRFAKIQDVDLREILLRDLHECAISISTGQNKSATVMCGSIIEALLLNKIMQKRISGYDISEIRRNCEKFPVTNMSLNELLYVADKEKLICKSNYHLSHYIRDYRNLVHPAKEIRTKQNISHENVQVIWSVLKQVINELLN